MVKKVGILTGGGDCPGLNAVIRAVTRRLTHEHGCEVVGYRDGFRGLVLDEKVQLCYDNVSGLLNRGGTILGTSNKDNPFNFAVPSGDGVEFKDMSRVVLENLEREQVEALITIGGDGTQTAAFEFSRMGLPVVGVPKTIDNDLFGTDTTFGFQTAVSTATDALDKLHSTAESHHRIMLLEVMGRYAGWISLAAGMAGGADVILIPEIEYNLQKVAEAIYARRRKGKQFSIVVVSEGVKQADGSMVIRNFIKDSPDQLRLGGVSTVLANQLEKLSGIEARAMVLGHLQRGGAPVAYDRLLATRFGAAAAERVMAGESGVMVALSGKDIVTVPLAEVAGRQRLVQPDDPLVSIGRSIGVSFGD